MENNSLLKILSNNNIGSRRKCFELIRNGNVEVNNKVIRDPSFLIDIEKDKIRVEGESIKIKKVNPVYIMMNKPIGVLSSSFSENGKLTLFDLLHHKDLKKIKLFNVGRLDFNSEGLIFLTNDGEFANKIIRPANKVLKHYIVEIKGNIKDEHIQRMKKGIYTYETRYKVEDVIIIKRSNKFTRLRIILNEGKNREIRNIFRILKYKIKKLKRVQIGPFKLPASLRPGEYKLISKKEIEKFLKS